MTKRRAVLALSTIAALLSWGLASLTIHSQTPTVATGFQTDNVDGHLVVAGEALVRFAPYVSSSAIGQIVQAAGGETVHSVGSGTWQLVHSSTRSAGMLMSSLAARGGVVQ